MIKGLKYLIIHELKIIKGLVKLIKYLFYDMIPEIYDVKWYKHDFKSKLEYYYWLPFRYLGYLIISLLDFEFAIYRIACLIGFMEGVLSDVKTSK